MEVDDVLVLFGDFDVYHSIMFCLVALPGNLFSVWHMMATVFLTAVPDTYHCTIPDGSSLNESIPIIDIDENGDPVYDSCSMYVNSSVDNSTTECTDGWHYEKQFEESIVTEWDLVCEDAFLAQLSQVIFMTGVMISSFVAGHLSDRHGRKTVFISSLWLQAIFGSLTAFSQYYSVFCCLRFVVGLLEEGVLNIQFVIVTEMFPPHKRTYAGFLDCMCWAVGMMLLAIIAYVFQHWRAFQLVISAPALLTFYYYWVLPESMRWLVSNGKVQDAETILYTAAKLNSVILPENILSMEYTKPTNQGKRYDIYHIHHEKSNEDHSATPRNDGQSIDVVRDNANDAEGDREAVVAAVDGETDIGNSKLETISEDPTFTFFDLLRTPTMALHTLIMSLSWFICSLVYYGLSYNTANFGVNVYTLFFLTGCVEIPAYALSMIVIVRFGRRWPTFLFMLTSGTACTCLAFIPTETDEGASLDVLRVIILLFGKFGITGAFGTIYVWVAELFPTLLRNKGLGVCAFCACVGGVIAPLTVYVAYYNIAIPMAVFGVLSLINSAAVLTLPETKNVPMPRTVEDVAKLKYWRQYNRESVNSLNDVSTQSDKGTQTSTNELPLC
ncbi:organic cation transporter protein-like [Saccoglossus kowalevskii]